ncbi:MAG: SsrA-binding protein SmpB [Planctomycetota bacterium]
MAKKSKAGAKAKSSGDGEGVKLVAKNNRAKFDYELLQKYEAGLVLLGTEIKSIRAGHVTLQEAYCRFESGELFLIKMHIPEYEMRGYVTHEPTRKRKLLLHRSEIRRIEQKIKERGLTLIPVRLYLKGGRAKIEIALAKGRKRHDKRQALASKEAKSEIRKAVR